MLLSPELESVAIGEATSEDRYTILFPALSGDQRMAVHISSLEDNAVFQVYGPGLEQTLDGEGVG